MPKLSILLEVGMECYIDVSKDIFLRKGGKR